MDSVFISDTKENARSNRQVWIFGLILAAAFFFCFSGVIRTLILFWWNNDMYSYGFLIPWISLYLIWIRRHELRQMPIIPNYTGGLFIVFGGLSLFLLGQIGAVIVLQELSLILTIVGIVLLLLGTRILRLLWFPIAYLLFMVPVWSFAIDPLHLPFQMFSASLGVKLLHLLGVPAYHQGTYIELPNVVLEVAKACSGVNYLIAVVAIGIPVAYHFLEGWLIRGLLVAFAVILAALGNSVRVALIGFISYHWTGEYIHGPYHVLQGLSVSMVGYLALFTGLSVLTKFSPKLAQTAKREAFIPGSGLNYKKWKMTFLVLTVSFLLLTAGIYVSLRKPSPVVLKAPFSSFPLQIGPWKGIEAPSDFAIFRESGADQELSRRYEKRSGEAEKLYIGYFESQDQNKKLIGYKTGDLDQSSSSIQIPLDSGYIAAHQIIQHLENRNRLVLYWYDLNGRMVANRFVAKAYLAWNSLVLKGTNGAVVMLSSDFDREEDLPRVMTDSEELIQETIPILSQYLPQK